MSHTVKKTFFCKATPFYGISMLSHLTSRQAVHVSSCMQRHHVVYHFFPTVAPAATVLHYSCSEGQSWKMGDFGYCGCKLQISNRWAQLDGKCFVSTCRLDDVTPPSAMRFLCTIAFAENLMNCKVAARLPTILGKYEGKNNCSEIARHLLQRIQ